MYWDALLWFSLSFRLPIFYFQLDLLLQKEFYIFLVQGILSLSLYYGILVSVQYYNFRVCMHERI